MDEQPKVSILGLCGSFRSSYTHIALERVLVAARGVGAQTEILNLETGSFPSRARSHGEPPPAVVYLRRRVREIGALVLATPEPGMLSAGIENAVEWLAPEGLSGKVVGLVSVAHGASASGPLAVLRELCLRQSACVVPIPVAIPMASRVFDNLQAPFSRPWLESLKGLGLTVAGCRPAPGQMVPVRGAIAHLVGLSGGVTRRRFRYGLEP